MRILHQIHTADPVGVGRKLCLYTMLEYFVLARLSAQLSCRLHIGRHKFRLHHVFIRFSSRFATKELVSEVIPIKQPSRLLSSLLFITLTMVKF